MFLSSWLRKIAAVSADYTWKGLRPHIFRNDHLRRRYKSISANSDSLERRILLSPSPITPEFHLNSETHRIQRLQNSQHPISAVDDNSFISFWQSIGQDGSGWGTYSRSFDTNGNSQANGTQVNSTARRGQLNGSVASGSSGESVMVWQSRGQDGRRSGIFFQRFDSDGNTVGSEILVNQTVRGTQRRPDVAISDDGSFVVVWDGRGTGDKNGVFARRFDSSGIAISPEIRINHTTQGRQIRPSVATDSSGGFVVSWFGRGIGDRNGVFVRRFDATANATTDEIRVHESTKDRHAFPAVAASDDGRFLVAWQAPDGRRTGVYAKQFNLDGTPLNETKIQVNSSRRGPQRQPAATYLDNGSFVVAWNGRGSNDRRGVYLREFGRNGTSVSAEIAVNQSTRGPQRRPGLAVRGDRLMVVWEGKGVGDRRGVFGRIFQVGTDDMANTGPRITQPANQTVEEQSLLEVPIQATDPDDDPLVYTLVDAPDGASINDSGIIAWTPTEDQGANDFQVTVRVTDPAGLTDQATFTITVTEINSAPQINTLGPFDVAEETTVTFTATATDSPNETLVWNLGEDAPDGAAITPSTGVFSWTPTEQDGPGTFDVAVIVTDGKGLSNTGIVRINVNEVNRSPVLNEISDQTINETATLNLAAMANDPDLPQNSLSYSLTDSIPTGATIHPETGQFTWTPTEVQGPGQYAVTVNVNDGAGGVDERTFTVNVVENSQAPVLSTIDDMIVNEQETLSFTVTSTDPDLPSDTLTYSLISGAPDGAVIHPATGDFSWTPTENQGPGAFDVTVAFSDGTGNSDVETFRVTVNEVNRPPVLSAIGDQTAIPGQALTLTATASDLDQPANTLTYSLDDGAPDGATIYPVTGVFSWTPNNTFEGTTASVTIRVTDNGSPALGDSETFTIAIGDCPFDENLTGWAVGENGGSTDGKGGATSDNCSAVLTEGDSFRVGLSTQFVVPENASTLSFSYSDLNFDTTNQAFVNDAFEAALLDSDGNSLVDSYIADRDAFFNITEGLNAVFGNDTMVENETVTVDISGVLAGQNATLVLRLSNNDNDTTSSVRIVDYDLPTQVSPNQAPVFSSDRVATSVLPATRTTTVQAGQTASVTNDSATADSTQPGSPTISVSTIPTDTSAGNRVLLSGIAAAEEVQTGGSLNTITHVTVNGKPVDVLDLSGRFFTHVDIQPGQNEFEIAAYDTADRKTVTAATVTGTQFETGDIDFNRFEDITGSFSGVYGRTSFRDETNSLYVDLATRNDGHFESETPLLVGVRNISDPMVNLVTPDGFMPNGTPYYDFTSHIADGRLDPGELSDSPTIAFHNPMRHQFDYELVFFGQLNEAPAITTLPKIATPYDRVYQYDVDAIDPDNDTLTYNLLTAPEELVINSATGRITWSPRIDDYGLHDVAIEVSDGRGGIITQRYTVSVSEAPPNRPPVITSVPQTQAIVTTVAAVEPIIVDLSTWSASSIFPDGTNAEWLLSADSTAVTQTENAAPAIFLSDFDVANKRIEGTWFVDADGGDDDFIGFVFGYQDAGHFYVLDWKKATEGRHGIGEEGFTIRVADTNEPITRQRDLWQTSGTSKVRTLDHGGVGWEHGVEYEFQIEFEPGLFTVRVTDGADTLYAATIQDDTFTDGRFGFYNHSQGGVTYTGFTRQSLSGSTYVYDVDAIDPDDDTLTYALADAPPEGMRINPSNGLISWAPDASQIGNNSVSVDVMDGNGGIATQNYTVCVHLAPTNSERAFADTEPNSAPVITSAPVTSATANQTWKYRIHTQDAEGDVVALSLEGAPAGMQVQLVEQRNAAHELVDLFYRIVWHVPEQSGGKTESVTVLADDGNGGTDRQTFTLDITDAPAANVNPVITSTPSPTVRFGLDWSYRVTASDANDDSLSYSLTVSPDGMQISDTGLITWTPPGDNLGAVPVEVLVEDGQGGQTTQSFDLHVVPLTASQSPVISSVPKTSAVIEQTYAYDPIGSDPDGDPLLWTLTVAPRGMSIDAQTGAIRWTADDQQIGTHNIAVTVTDPLLGEFTQRFELHVGCNNLAPVIVSIPPTEALIDRTYLYPVRGSDLEGDTLTWTLASAPNGMSIDAETGVIRWTPNATQFESHDVIIEVSDGFSTASQIYSVVVGRSDEPVAPNDPTKGTKGNRAPIVTSTPVFAAETDFLYTYQVIAVDPDGDAFTLNLGPGGPTEMAISDTGLISWTPTTANIGEHLISVVATDDQGATSTQGYLLSVATNSPPQITSPAVTSAISGAKYRYTVRVADPESDPISYRLDDAPEGMTVDNFGRIIWQTAVTDIDPINVTVTVADDRGQIDTQTWQITPVPDTIPPVVSLQVQTGELIYDGNAQVDIGSTYVVEVQATDNVGVAELGLKVDGEVVPLDQRGRFTLTGDQLALVNLQATATDISGNEGTSSAVVNVIDPSQPNRPIPTDPTLPIHPGFDPDDNGAPFVEITSPAAASVLSNRTSIIGTVDDPEDNLWYYRVLVSRLDRVSISSIDLGDPDWTILHEGTEEVIDGELAVFDPSSLSNDAYAIVVAAFDVNGKGFVQPTVVTVEGNVNVGNFRFEVTDLSIPLAGIPIQITRVYDTLNAGDEGDFGYGWSFGTQDAQILETVPNGYEFIPGETKVYLTAPDGRRIGFTYEEEPVPLFCLTPDGCLYVGFFGDRQFKPTFRPDPGVYETLEIDMDKVSRGGLSNIFGSIGKALNGGVLVNPSFYTLTTKDGLKYRYHQDRGLETITDLNGNKVTFSEDGIKHSSGASIDFVRDHRGRITEIVDPADNAIQFDYDLAGDLTRVTNQAGLETRYTYLDNPLHYLDEAYDSLGRRVLKTVFEENPETGRLEFMGLIDAAGNRVDEREFDTDANTGVIRDAGGNATTLVYDDRGNVLTETDPLGNVTIREYNDPQNPDLETRIIDREGNITDREYDSRGNLTTITERGSSENPLEQPVVTSFSYDEGNRVTSITNAANAMTGFDYDASGNLVEITNALADVSAFTYDSQGRRTAFTDFNGNTTTFEYSSGDQSSKVVFADGTYQAFEYNQFGQVTLEQYHEADGDLTESRSTVYDSLGRVRQEFSGVADDPDHPQTIVLSFYDGQLLDWEAVVSPESLDTNRNFTESPATPIADRKSRITDYEYDTNDRLIRQTDAEGGVVEFRYDANGNRVLLQDPVGNVTTWVYDGLNRVIEERDPFYWEDVRASDTELQALPDAEWLEQIAPVIPISANNPGDPLYDDPSGADIIVNQGAEHVRIFGYDAEGNQAKVIDRNGRRREFEYDIAGRLLTESWFAASTGELVETITFTYDSLGNMLTATDSNSDYLFTYDTLNRLESVDNNPNNSRDVPRVVLNYGYDAQGNVTLTQDDAGVTVESEYDERNRLQIRKWYDDDGSGDVDDARVDFRYNATGRESEVRRYSDLSATNLVGRTTRTYDLAGRSDRLVHLNGVDELIAGYDYDYDFSGLLTHEERTHQDAQVTQSITYRYDLSGQLTDALFSGQNNEHYEYDANGNRITSEVGSEQRTYTTGPANQLESDGIFRYEYDGEGNQIKRIDLVTGETRTLEYDHHNLLVRVDDWSSDPGDPQNPAAGAVLTQSVEYTYDVLGRRIAREVDPDGVALQPSEKEFFGYNGDNVWADFNESGEAAARYLVGMIIDEYIARNHISYSTHWYLSDDIGTVRDIMDTQKSFVNRTEYESFGTIVSQSSDVHSERISFAGREYEQHTGDFFYRTRFVSPTLGRFNSQDVIGFEGGTANLYSFVANSPLNFVDPFGTTIAERGLLGRLQTRLAPALRKVGCEVTKTAVEEGVYIFVATIGGRTRAYVGQSNNIPRRIREHIKKKSIEITEIINIAVPGGKTSRENVEQFILDLLGGKTPTHNKVNPISPSRTKRLGNILPKC